MKKSFSPNSMHERAQVWLENKLAFYGIYL